MQNGFFKKIKFIKLINARVQFKTDTTERNWFTVYKTQANKWQAVRQGLQRVFKLEFEKKLEKKKNVCSS